MSGFINILIEAKKHSNYSGKTPIGLAGAALYIASNQNGERRSQKCISDVAGVSEATIRSRYKELVKIIKI